MAIHLPHHPKHWPILEPIKDAFHAKFLPAILGPDIAIGDNLCNLLVLSIKAGRVAIRNPTLIAYSLFCTSQDASSYLFRSLLCNEPICTHHHQSAVSTAGDSRWKEHCDGDRPSSKHSSSARGQSCGKGFTVEHVLNCKKGGLVGIHHDDAHDEWTHLCSLAFSNAQVVIKPTIGNDSNPGARHAVLPTPPPSPTDTLGDESRGDVLMHGFWQCARGTIFDIRICDTDARPYANTSSSKEKVQKYKPACITHGQDFTPLVYSADGLAFKEARKAEQCLACILASKWDQAYSDTANFICVRMSLPIIWSNTLLLCGEHNHSLRHQAPNDCIAVTSLDLLCNE
ncbi:hypothetical protein ACHAW6_006145 [Cyclotella cf. meneghiniana]